ncbi:alpha-glucan family phosphorylase [candidate division KSB1 bacterium]
MRPIRTFKIDPSIPIAIEDLREITYNLWWSWDHEAIELLRRIDRDLWEKNNHNPATVLGLVDQARLEHLAADDGFLAHLDRIRSRLRDYLGRTNWFQKTHPDRKDLQVAYFSAEFGIDESLPIYAGGLGVLAGDHIQSASDLGLPLVGVGLLYQEGYFRQYLNPDGWQQEIYPRNDFHNLTIRKQTGEDGEPLIVSVELPGGKALAQVWKLQVGRITVFLLDTNLQENSPIHQSITAQLYGGDGEMRIMQEMVLGIGGLRALNAMGISPTVCHMNEGHSAFLVLERLWQLMKDDGLNFDQAWVATSAGNVFTTHTPVEAGHDRFPPELIKRYVAPWFKRLGITEEKFLSLGRVDPTDPKEEFCMTVLALKASDCSNSVSRLHGEVSRRMWQSLWPGVPEREVPIKHITNGIHTPSWVSAELAELFHRYIGPRWREEPADQSVWDRVDLIPAEELWRCHERRRERLVAYARTKLADQLNNRGASAAEIEAAEGVLNPETLTIGFARRFASYKRAHLIFKDQARLKAILRNRERPVQLIIAGKAHPKDDKGKEIIRDIIHFARDEEIRRHVVFLEDYDICLARYLVQGVDVWLNTPRRLMEASGTSGMKAAVNGAPNLSILDGWWQEAFTPEVGWAIGKGEDYEDLDYQDRVESEALYDLLEEEVVPRFYNRGNNGLPRDWIDLMKSTLRRLCPIFNTNRMVHEYLESFYLPTFERYGRLVENGEHARVKALEEWGNRMRRSWAGIEVAAVTDDVPGRTSIGSDIQVEAVIKLGEISPEEVSVELFQGQVDSKGEFLAPSIVPMHYQGVADGGTHRFAGVIRPKNTGLGGFTLRILPKHSDLANPLRFGLVHWA